MFCSSVSEAYIFEEERFIVFDWTIEISKISNADTLCAASSFLFSLSSQTYLTLPWSVRSSTSVAQILDPIGDAVFYLRHQISKIRRSAKFVRFLLLCSAPISPKIYAAADHVLPFCLGRSNASKTI